MHRIRTTWRVAFVGWLLTATLLLPLLNSAAHPNAAHATESTNTPTPTATATPTGLGGNGDDDDG
jgi:hypothetical protein